MRKGSENAAQIIAGMNTARFFTASLLAFFALGPLAACASGKNDVAGSIDVGGVKRTYVAHVPAHLGASVPLVFAFHGRGGNGAEQSRLSRLDTLADRYGFIVLYPNGLRREWNDGDPGNGGADDVGFVRALIADFSKRYPIDRKRIYATGFSNGATFTQYLGCVLSSQLAAIAPVSGSMPVEDAPTCRPRRAISVLEIAGTADPIMPYDGGEITILGHPRGKVRSAAQSVAFWAQNAGCGGSRTTMLPQRVRAGRTHVTRTTYEACAKGANVVLYTVKGGGHTWPGGPQYLPRAFVGRASRQLDASAAIVAFFLAHPMR